jgi:hypothetical protein
VISSYDITNTSAGAIQITDAFGNPISIAAGTTASDVSLNSTQYTAMLGIFGAANIVLYVAPPAPTIPEYQYAEIAITSSAVSQALFSSVIPLRGFEIINNSNTFTLYFREGNVATIGAPSTALEPLNAYTSPLTYVPIGAINVASMLVGHPLTARFF